VQRRPNQHGSGVEVAQGRSADAEEGAVEWYPSPDSGQLRGHHVSPRLQHPPPNAGQLWGRHVSSRLRLPPPGLG
jgi:hypothetical protein